jgi:hypothetical protein
MSQISTSRFDRNYANDLPDRNGSDIPAQVQWFLSVCELACVYQPWLQKHIGSGKDKFCEGVTDYWWDYDELEEPSLDMVFNIGRVREPSQERIAYQKGAIVGYELAERYK